MPPLRIKLFDPVTDLWQEAGVINPGQQHKLS